MSEHSKQKGKLVSSEYIKKNNLQIFNPSRPHISLPKGFSKEGYFKWWHPGFPHHQDIPANQKFCQDLLLSCCSLCRKTHCGQTFLKMLMLKAFISLRKSSYFNIWASIWLAVLPSAEIAMDPVLSTWEVKEFGFLFIRSLSRAGRRSLQWRTPHTLENWWGPYKPDRRTRNWSGHLHYSCWSTSTMATVWFYILSH